MKENKLNALISITKIIGKNSTSPLLFKDVDAANEILKDLKSEPDIVNAVILDSEQKIFSKYDKIKTQTFDFKNFNKVEVNKENLLYSQKISDGEEEIGTIYVKASLKSLNKQLYQKIKLTSLIILLSILISFFFASIFQKYISFPIQKLARLMENVAKSKNFSLRSEIKTKDEIGTLSNEFNELLSKIEKHDHSLNELNIQLEEKVQERTQELEIKNKKLYEAKKQAEKSKQVKEQFLASMSHEIRTPLNAILGFQELLKTTELNEEQKEYIHSIDFAGRNLLVLINDVLDISKIEAGKFIFEEVELNITEVLKSVIELVGFRAKEKNLSLEYHDKLDFSSSLYGDSARLTQILLNLIGNAIKFTDKGGITISIHKLEENDLTVKILFEVKDTGIGISAENIDSVFDSFTQASSETNRKYGGTGLGLTIVKQLVELQGGEISVSSEINKGSTFSFSLTFKKGRSNTNSRRLDLNTSGFDFLLKGKEILLVEDMLLNQNLVKKIMNKWGINLDIANNGIQALEKLKTKKYDLILMDIQMPEMDGYETTQHIRNNDNIQISQTPIIALTAHASSSEAEKCINLGMNAYLAKPFKTELLKNQILNTLNTLNKNQVFETKKHYDLTYLKEHADGDENFLREMIQIFLKDTPQIISDLKTSINEENFEKIKFNSHSMKGGFLTLGITQAGELIREIERMAEQKSNLQEINKHFVKIEKIFNETQVLLEEELEKI
jgi:signal transduction histidine kinase/CheY-like chemotaxis protein